MKGPGRLVVGGRPWRELQKNSAAKRWLLQGITAGRVRRVARAKVEAQTEEVAQDPRLASNDPQVIALARVGGARLLYSNDRDLQQDFRNQELTPSPRGRVFTSLPLRSVAGSRRLRDAHKGLLRRRDLRAGCD